MSILGLFASTLKSAGGGGSPVSLSNIDIADEETSPTDADARMVLGASGGITYTGNVQTLVPSSWGSGVLGIDYEARMTTISGSLTTGTAGTWQALTIGLTYARTRTNNAEGSDVYHGTLEIRDVATQTVQDSCDVLITGTVLGA